MRAQEAASYVGPPVDTNYSMAEELTMLTSHGVLHLLGYDHAEPEEEREMFALQGKLLAAWQERR